MALCRYCKKDAGFLKGKYKECKNAFDEGTANFLEQARKAALSLLELQSFKSKIDNLKINSFIDEQTAKQLIVKSWEDAVHTALEDKILSKDEEKALLEYCEHFSLEQNDLDKNGNYTRMVKCTVLREVMEGRIPEKFKVDGQLPFNFQKDEKLVWLFQNVPCYEQRTRTQYQGGSVGVSTRIMKGVYLRTSSFRGNPITTTSMVQIGVGLFGITNKHIYFSGSSKSFRIPYNKIISFQSYSDGIGIQKDGVTAKPLTFITNDGWFTNNLISNLAKL